MNGLPEAKILLVDDLEENLVALSALLRQPGVELLKARSGREALELLLVHDVALALLDVQMPEMDGFELAELMRGTARTRHVPIIFVTAGAHDAHRVFRGYEAGAVDFLFKPLDTVLLGHKVRTFVDLCRQRLELERLTEEHREALRLNEMFVAAVSHDLRAPLSTIITGAALIGPAIVDASGKRVLTLMRSSGQRMIGMLDQLADLARARLGGGIILDTRDTNFRTIADKVVDELRVAHPERNVIVEYDNASTSGSWDEGRLAQVVTNLVGNAVKYGTPNTDVRMAVRGSGPALVIEVHNAGEIPEAVRDRLFDPFRRGAQRSADGLGLGLYIVRQIVAAHGGTIDVRSSREGGTTFRVELPRAPTEE